MGRRPRLATVSLVAWLIGFAATAHAAPGCEPGAMATKYPSLAGKTVKIGADPQTPPYAMRDATDFNKVTGSDIDLAAAVLDCVGVKHEMFVGGWSGLMPATAGGQIDIFWDNLYYTPERAKQLDYVMYMQAATGAMTQAGNPKKILDAKFSNHQPLNRQSEMYAPEGIELDVSTLADWVGACTATLSPLVALIRDHVLAAERIHGDDTRVPVLAKGKTVTGRLWTYVRDDRPFGGTAPPSAMFYFSRDRRGEHLSRHLAGYCGILQADAYAGF